MNPRSRPIPEGKEKITQDWTRENLAWCGGLFEGEGCISISHNQPALFLNMTDKDTVDKFCRIMGLGKVRERKPHKKHWKLQHVWQVSGVDGYAVLCAIYPHLGERRKSKALDFIKEFSTQTPGVNKLRGNVESTTLCGNGHWITEDNKVSDGSCKICLNERSKRYKEDKNRQ